MKKLLSIILVLILTMSLFAGCNTQEDAPIEEEEVVIELTESEKFDAFLQRLAVEALESSPITATFTLGDLEANGLFELASELDHIDLEEYGEAIATTREELIELEAFNYDELSKSQQLNYDLAKFNIDHSLAMSDFLYIDNVIQPSAGVQVNFPLALMQIEFESREEIDAFVLRVKEVPRLFDEVVIYEQERFELGYGLPGYLYDEVVEQIDAMLVEPEDFMMYLSFVDRIDAFEGLTDEERDAYKSEYLDIVTNELYPAFEVLKDQALAMNGSTASGSISEWADGRDYYDALVKYKTSDELDVEGLEAWASDQITELTIAFQNMYASNPEIFDMDFENIFPEYESLDEIYDIVDEVYKTEFMDYGVTFATENIIPEYLEEHLAAGFYFPVTVDGEDYGNMFLQADDYDEVTEDTVILYYHENIPGHHLYYSYISTSDEPLFRKMNEYLTYEEGWATYVQNLSFSHMGLPEGVDEFFLMNSAYSNAFLVLIDIKLHYEGLSVEEVKNEMMMLGFDEEGADSTITRMISKPGEMIHYMFGEYKMSQMKETFIEVKGDEYDVKDFHDFILSHYGLPFYVLEDELEDMRVVVQ